MKHIHHSWFLNLLIGLFITCFVNQVHATIPDESKDKINLALRRTADKLLRASGDDTSRIPPVEQTAEHVWRVKLNQPFEYDSLPRILEASLQQYGIQETYQVAIRKCEDDIIDLGYQQKDILHDTMVACGGRIEPKGCHFIEVTFTPIAENKTFTARTSLLLLTFLAAGVLLWYSRKKPDPISVTDDEDNNWLPFGQSRLHLSGQVLESSGVRQQLTYREAKLLNLFVTHPSQLLEREYILQQIWGDEGVQVGRSVDMFVSRLRKKLKSDPSVGIVAIHGLGYKLETRLEKEEVLN